MKKIISSVLLAVTMTLSSVANANLIDITADSHISGAIGGFSWLDENDSQVVISDPFQFLEGFGFLKTEIFNGSFSNIALGSTGQPIQTAGGHYEWNTFYRFGSPDTDGLISGLSIEFDYVTTLFTKTTYLADLIGSITYNTQVFDITGSIFGDNNPASNNIDGTSSSAWTMDFNHIADAGNFNPGISVPEPSTFALLGLAVFGLISRKLPVNKAVWFSLTLFKKPAHAGFFICFKFAKSLNIIIIQKKN